MREGRRRRSPGTSRPWVAGFVLSARRGHAPARQHPAGGARVGGQRDRTHRRGGPALAEGPRRHRRVAAFDSRRGSAGSRSPPPRSEALRIYTQSERAADRAGAMSKRSACWARHCGSTRPSPWPGASSGVVLGNQRRTAPGRDRGTIKAYDLRDRLPERERMQATAYYYCSVENDRDKVIARVPSIAAALPGRRERAQQHLVGADREAAVQGGGEQRRGRDSRLPPRPAFSGPTW